MKKIKGLRVLLLVALIFSMSLMAGCGEDKSGNTIEEPEITADYLAGEYSDQLKTDGANIMIGFVALEKNGESYVAHITEKEVVPNEDYDEGYYLADTNVSKDVALGYDARMTCMKDGELQVVNADEFIENNGADSEQLYKIYLMGESADLLIAIDPMDAIEQ